ncbi:APC family permease [Pseudohongiella sp.]|uniref:Amino acid permease/ SLC12A domain-containing protein n=1 Tax=marine sediment metagenome TaxID=412755 RepID=A0A0F9Y362_9ZZZZ|nr:amino acid permease [Pseudohongiella sp.]
MTDTQAHATGAVDPRTQTSARYTPATAIAVVVANMVGTGVFTSLGYQIIDIKSTFVLLMLWLVGGVAALCGALTYAELASRLPRSGGEYNFLSQLYHPSIGFVSGWVSLTVGFAAPTALAAMTFAAYLDSSVSHLVPINRMMAALVLVAVVTFVHGRSHKASGGLQNWFTVLKVLLIVGFVGLIATTVEAPQQVNLLPTDGDGTLLLSSAFAVSLIYVNYAYTGWNSATYITGEVDNPARTVPMVLIGGTAIVILLYLALNAAFLYAVPMTELEGRLEIGVVVAQATFGSTGALVMGGVLSLLLISTVSAMLMAGPRVLQVMGEDFRLFRLLAMRNKSGVPRAAVYTQGGLTILFIVTSTFESVLVFSGFILGLSSLATVLGIFVLRFRKGADRQAGSYRTWLFPLPPLLYSAIMIWTLSFIAFNRPQEAAIAGIIIALGFASYVATEKFSSTISESVAKQE